MDEFKSAGSILVVDDSVENIIALDSILSKNYDIKAVKSGELALKLLDSSEQLPDLILMDIMMPVMDGYEVCRLIKSSNKTAHIPVIFITAKNEYDEIVEGFSLGAVDYVCKPFNSSELLARVKTHIKLKQTDDELKKVIALKDSYINKLQLINIELERVGEMDATKIDYLLNRLRQIINGHVDTQTQMELAKNLISLIAINDLGNLKIVLNILEGSKKVIDRIVKEPVEDEECFRILTSTIEPFSTAIADIENFIKVLVSIGFIEAQALESTDVTKTAFFETLQRILKEGKLSSEKFKILLDLASFKLKSQDSNSTIIF